MNIEKEFREEKGRHVAILRASGKITIGLGDTQLREAIRSVCDWNVVLDMAQVTIVDSSGLGELVASYTTLANSHRELAILNLPEGLKELLHVTQLIVCFNVYDDEEKAVASFDTAA